VEFIMSQHHFGYVFITPWLDPTCDPSKMRSSFEKDSPPVKDYCVRESLRDGWAKSLWRTAPQTAEAQYRQEQIDPLGYSSARANGLLYIHCVSTVRPCASSRARMMYLSSSWLIKVIEFWGPTVSWPTGVYFIVTLSVTVKPDLTRINEVASLLKCLLSSESDLPPRSLPFRSASTSQVRSCWPSFNPRWIQFIL
jgi:hypothetical protein